MEVAYYSCSVKYICLNGQAFPIAGESGELQLKAVLGTDYDVIRGVLDSNFGYMIRHRTLEGLLWGLARISNSVAEEAA